jgi:lipopolysaccharide biosynthesis glycosyltransferase
MQTSIIHIAMAFDQNYITPFYVLLTSIFLNNKGNSIHFHVILTGASADERAVMASYVEQHDGKLFFYTIPEESVHGFVIPEGSYITIATYYRLFLPALLPNHVTTLLYLDTDVLVLKDLFELCTLDLGSLPAAAVADAEMKLRPDLSIYSRDDYFNAGVLLINLAEWKQQQISEKAANFLREFPEKIKFVDQDALNAVLVGNWLKLDTRYNVFPSQIPYGSREVNAFEKDKAIIHFVETKPWLYWCRNRLRHLYYYYHKKSPRHAEDIFFGQNFSLAMVKSLTQIKAVDLYYEYPFLMKNWRQIKSLLKRQQILRTT